MPEPLLWSAVFLITLITLIVAADFFIKSSERIGLALGIPPFIIGVTLIAVGTSLPELVTSIIAVIEDSSEIVAGNVIGSNISNLCLILGIIAVRAKRIKLVFDVMQVDLPMFVGTALLLWIFSLDHQLSLFEAILCLTGLAIYLGYIIHLGKSDKEPVPLNPEPDVDIKVKALSWKEPVILLISATAIYFSADYNVAAIVNLAYLLGVGRELIALTAVSLGTSLPELIVSIVAVRTGNAEMAVGNILGSNIFNVFAVMGIPRLFGPILIPETITSFSLPVMLAASALAFLIIQDQSVNRWEGYLLLLFYLLFIGNLIR
jgi:cation:H+ antiporter